MVDSQARQFVPGWKRWNDRSACIIVSCTTSSASARFRSNHMARRKRRSACGNTSPSNAAQASESSRESAWSAIELQVRRTGQRRPVPYGASITMRGRNIPWTTSAAGNGSAVRAIQDKIQEPLQVVDDSVRSDAQLLQRLTEPVHPNSGIPKRLRAGRVPSSKRGKNDVALVELETIDAQLIRARIRLIGVTRVRADQRVEQRHQASTLGVLPEHGRTEIRDRDHADVCRAQST